MFRSKKLLLSVITLIATHGLVAMEEDKPLLSQTILATSALAKDGYTHYGQLGLCYYKQDDSGRVFPMTTQDLQDVGITLKKSQKIGSFAQEHHLALGNTTIGAIGLGTTLMKYHNGTLETPSDFALHVAKTLTVMGIYSTLATRIFTPNDPRSLNKFVSHVLPFSLCATVIATQEKSIPIIMETLVIGSLPAYIGALYMHRGLCINFEKNKIALNRVRWFITGEIKQAIELFENYAQLIAKGQTPNEKETQNSIEKLITIRISRKLDFDTECKLKNELRQKTSAFYKSTPKAVQANLNALTDILGLKRIVIQKDVSSSSSSSSPHSNNVYLIV